MFCLFLGVVLCLYGCSADEPTGEEQHGCNVCGHILSVCFDGDNDHICDQCGASVSECTAPQGLHVCGVCGDQLSDCTDSDQDHRCDVCGATLTFYVDDDGDHVCDVCGDGIPCSDSDTDGICDTCKNDLEGFEFNLEELAFEYLDLSADAGIGIPIVYENEHFVIFYGEFGLFGLETTTNQIVFEMDFPKAFGPRANTQIQGQYGITVVVDANGEVAVVTYTEPELTSSYSIHIPSRTFQRGEVAMDEAFSNEAVEGLVMPLGEIRYSTYMRDGLSQLVFLRYPEG